MPLGVKRQKCYGVLAPERLYTKEGVMRAAGLGSESLLKAKQSGMVTAIPCGVRVYFKGSELIEWIASHGQGGSDAGSR